MLQSPTMILDYLFKQRKSETNEESPEGSAASKSNAFLESQSKNSPSPTVTNEPSASKSELSANEAYDSFFQFYPKADKFERLKAVFTKNDYGFRSYEFSTAWKICATGFAVGLIFRGPKSLRAAVDRFKVQHNHSLFENKFEYQRRLATYLMLSQGRERIPFGIKYGAFAFSMIIIPYSLAAYRDKLFLSDFVMGGAVTGFMLRLFYGYKAAFVGTIVGTSLGLIFAASHWALLSYAKISPDEFYKMARQEHYAETLKKLKEDNEKQEILEKEQFIFPWQMKSRIKELKQIDEERKMALIEASKDIKLNLPSVETRD